MKGGSENFNENFLKFSGFVYNKPSKFSGHPFFLNVFPLLKGKKGGDPAAGSPTATL